MRQSPTAPGTTESGAPDDGTNRRRMLSNPARVTSSSQLVLSAAGAALMLKLAPDAVSGSKSSSIPEFGVTKFARFAPARS
jgi:hypothetical protein